MSGPSAPTGLKERDPSRFVDAEAREMIRSALGETLAVEAAAGTGKTTVLVDRIINVIAQGITTVDRIVAVTFTEKAAGELKLRLRAKVDSERMKLLSDEIEIDADGCADTNDGWKMERAANLAASLANLEQAHVSTIHGFCADLLRERPVEARVDPQFTTLTEAQSERLYGDVFRDWLQQQLEAPPEGVRRALRRQSFDAENGPIKRLERAGWTLVDWRDFTTPWRRDPFDRFGAIDALVAQLDKFTALTKAPADRRDPFFDSTEDARRLFDEISRAESPIPGDDETLRPRSRPRDYDGLEARLVSLNSWRFRDIRQGRRTAPYSKGVSRAEVIAAHQALVERLEAFQRAADADLAALLQSELRETVARYEVAKARLGALDFLDLLIRARDLVRDHDEVRAAFQQRFTHLFIDEFQDTDPLQAELLLLLAAEDPAERTWRDVVPTRGKLFIVGDPKQSIYRFRRADVGVYQDVRDQLARHGAKLLTLTTSFRSMPMIQRAVNAGFAPSMQGDRAALQADYVPLSPARDDLAPQPSVVALPVPRPYGDRGYITKAAIGASLPDAVGAFVDWLITKSGWTVTEREHPDRRVPIQARHVCLLFRRFDTRVFGRGESWMEDVTRPYVQALECRGVPHVLVGGKSFHDREEVETMRTALAAIEWPEDELSVFGTLRGSLFAMDDETLFAYRRQARRINPFRGAGNSDEFRVVEEALDILRELHVRRNYRPVPETIARLLDASRAHVALVLRPSGEQALANVQYIAELARQYEASGGISFRGFVEQLRDEAESVRSAEAPILEEGSEGVRLMTVHRAKGLEFPIVILADTTAELSRKTASRWVDAQSGRCAVSLAGWAPADLRDHEAEEVARDEAEGVRVAYVAATRARDLLVIPAVGDAAQGGWVSPLNAAIYPADDARRDPVPDGAPGCPAFSKDSLYEREGTIPFTSVCPGLHRLTPNVLTLDRSAKASSTKAAPANVASSNVASAKEAPANEPPTKEARVKEAGVMEDPARIASAKVVSFASYTAARASDVAAEGNAAARTDANANAAEAEARAIGSARRDGKPAEGADAIGADAGLDAAIGSAASQGDERDDAPATSRDADDAASPAAYDVVWWDPASLDLDRAPNYGLRREELIAKDAPPAVIAEGQSRYYTWRAAREGALERGATPSQRIVTVRARAAAVTDGEEGEHSEHEQEHGPAPEPHETLPPVEIVDVRTMDGSAARPSGVRFGALVHAVLALVPLDAADEAVRKLAAQQARVLGASAGERDACVPAVIAALRHPLFARARAARDRGRLRRETPLAFLDIRQAIVEGVIDLAFEEDAGWVVVDFKTDHELTGVPLDTYRRQVALYAAGISRATGRPATGILLRL